MLLLMQRAQGGLPSQDDDSQDNSGAYVLPVGCSQMRQGAAGGFDAGYNRRGHWNSWARGLSTYSSTWVVGMHANNGKWKGPWSVSSTFTWHIRFIACKGIIWYDRHTWTPLNNSRCRLLVEIYCLIAPKNRKTRPYELEFSL